MRYPESHRGPVVENLHGHEIADPYRWLEDPDAEQTRAWVEAQRSFTEDYLATLPERAWFVEQMTQIVGTPMAYAPTRQGGWYFFSRRDAGAAQPCVYVARSLDEAMAGGRLLFDSSAWSPDGTSSLQLFSASRDGHYCGYFRSEAGSDWQHYQLVEIATGREIDDADIVTKFSGIAWMPDHESFLYVRRRGVTRAEGTDVTEIPVGDLMQHRVGTGQDEDVMVWENPGDHMLSSWATPSHDGRWLLGTTSWGTERANAVWIAPIAMADGRATVGERIEILPEPTMAAYPLDVIDGHLLLQIDDRPNGRIVSCPLEPTPEFTEVVAESEPIYDVALAKDTIIVVRMIDVSPRFELFSFDGTRRGALELPAGAFLELVADRDRDEALISLSSVTQPTTAFAADVATGVVRQLQLLPTSDNAVAPQQVAVTTRRCRATSKDGTQIPYFLIAQEGHDFTTPCPTLVYGYGGFTVPVLPDFRPGWGAWLAAGGVLVIANLRGGTEYGRDWYEGGRGPTKQNVFDDVNAIGEHLQQTGVAGENHLVIHGRSNGGLLAGAALTQRPDLWTVALPVVGVLDMLRFHKFTGGLAWASDYGNPDVAEDFEIALGYSPLHAITEGAHYPATLVATGDHDDRVVPLHSFKFAATLQYAQAGDAPVLIRIEQATGHGMGKPASMLGQEWADLLAFAAHHTGLVPSQQ